MVYKEMAIEKNRHFLCNNEKNFQGKKEAYQAIYFVICENIKMIQCVKKVDTLKIKWCFTEK